ncbi:hypothetical protein B296_00007025 [Ensete ventricosum]|uniref:Uncharacterized protein n=1 Tax=Ensete ventricosum TaxID=4639 RepID=A0A427BAZ8_ENSVE|nr:hypothetical protein B296_00007025 [Ensete ventricosum]
MCTARTSLPTDRHADHPLLGDTIDWGCFRPVTTRNRLVTIDFDPRRPILGGISRGRDKEEEGEEKPGVALLFPCTIRYPRAISSSAGDFFSPHGEKKRLPTFAVSIHTSIPSSTRYEEIARERRIAQPTDQESDAILQVLPFLLLFFSLPPSTDTARNRPPTVKIDRSRPTATATVEIDRYRLISDGNRAETTPIDRTIR